MTVPPWQVHSSRSRRWSLESIVWIQGIAHEEIRKERSAGRRSGDKFSCPPDLTSRSRSVRGGMGRRKIAFSISI